MENEKYVGQRGPDKEQREFNPKSLLNLKQFQKPETTMSSAVNSDVNWVKLGKIAVVAVAISAVIWKLYQRRKRLEDTELGCSDQD